MFSHGPIIRNISVLLFQFHSNDFDIHISELKHFLGCTFMTWFQGWAVETTLGFNQRF